MKKIILLIGVLLLIQFCSANEFTFPKSEFSDSTYLGNYKMKTTFYLNPKYYFDDLELKAIDSRIVPSTNKAYDYMVIKGNYKVLIRKDGTYYFENDGYKHRMKLSGFVFLNVITKELVYDANLNFNSPTTKPVINQNKIQWNLLNGVEYFLSYENSQFRDVLFFPDSFKVNLKKNLPEKWKPEETFFGLVYETDLINSSIQGGNNFETSKALNFVDEEGNVLHSIRESLVLHQDWNHFFSSDTNNEGFEWQRLRMYSEGEFFDLTSADALFSGKGGLLWNATTQVDLNASANDCDEHNMLGSPTVRLTGTSLFWANIRGNITTGAGLRFEGIDLNQDDGISEVILKMKGGRTCGSTPTTDCEATIYGTDVNYIEAWGASNKPSDFNGLSGLRTTEEVDFSFDTDFVVNDAWDAYDMNVTLVVEEIMDRLGWIKGNPIGFVLDVDSIPSGKQINIYAFDNGSNFAFLEFTHFGKEFTACDPEPDKNHVLDVECYYNSDQNIDLGSGSLFILRHGFIGCDNSVYSVSNWIKCQPRDNFFWTNNSDINVSAFWSSKDGNKMSYDFEENTHDAGVEWVPAFPCCDENHFAEFDVNGHYVRNISFPVDYDNGWANHIWIEYYKDGSWTEVKRDSDFTPAECDFNGLIGGTAWCDINATINTTPEKIKFSFDGNSMGGAYDQDNDLNIYAVSRVLIWGKQRKQYCMEYANGGYFTVRQ